MIENLMYKWICKFCLLLDLRIDECCVESGYFKKYMSEKLTFVGPK